MADESKTPESQPTPRAPYPHDWAGALIGTAAGALVVLIGAYLLIAHVSSRPVDLRPLTDRAFATIEARLAANRIPEHGISVSVEPVRNPEAWFDYARYDVAIPRHLDMQALSAVIRKSLLREGVAVDVQEDGRESVLQLAAAGAEIGTVRLLAARSSSVDQDFPDFAEDEEASAETQTAPEQETTAGGVRAEAVRIQLPGLSVPTPRPAEPVVSDDSDEATPPEPGSDESEPARLPGVALPSPPPPADVPAATDTETSSAAQDPPETESETAEKGSEAETMANWSPPAGSLPEFDAGSEIPDATSNMRVAIIVDDGGYGGPTTEAILALDPNLTLSILPYTPYARETAERATELGFEVMLHMPMENLDANLKHDGQLDIGMSPARIHALTLRALDYVPGAKGVNNHMGSRFTADRFFMDTFLEGIEDLDLYFVDSRTTSNSVAYLMADQREIPSAYRHIFLDHDNKTETIEKQFDQMIELAQQQGDVVAIAHFRPNTANVLARMLPKLQESGVALVHASALFE